jgi:HK97 family phage major capsid protein
MAIDTTKPEYKELKSALEKDLDLKDKINKEFGVFKEENLNIQKMVDEQVEKALKTSIKPVTGETDSKTIFKKAWDSGAYLKGLWTAEQNVPESKQGSVKIPNMEATMKALGEAQGSTGAFLLFTEFLPELQKLIIEKQIVRKYAKVIPMNQESIRVPRIYDSTHYNATYGVQVHGGMTANVAGEASDRSSTAGDPAFADLTLIAKVYAEMHKVSNELLMDSPMALAPLLQTLLFESLGFREDYDCLLGNGVNKCLGALNSGNASLITTTRTVTSRLTFDDAINQYTSMLPSSVSNAIWVCSPSSFADVMKFSVVVGIGGSSVMIGNYPGQSGVQAPPAYLLGRPIFVSEKVPALGTAGDLSFCDYSYYLLGDRMQPTLTTSDQRYFETYQTAFLLSERIDGQPWLSTKLTAANNSDTLSAFVTTAA